MKSRKNLFKTQFEIGSKQKRSPYENLINSLKHAYDTIPVGENTAEDYLNNITKPSSLIT